MAGSAHARPAFAKSRFLSSRGTLPTLLLAGAVEETPVDAVLEMLLPSPVVTTSDCVFSTLCCGVSGLPRFWDRVSTAATTTCGIAGNDVAVSVSACPEGKSRPAGNQSRRFKLIVSSTCCY